MDKIDLPSSPSIHELPPELISTILQWVLPLHLLKSASFTCRQFSEVIQSDNFWHQLVPNKQYLNQHQLQRYLLYVFQSNPNHIPGLSLRLRYGSLLASFADAQNLSRKGFRVCLASTTDHNTESVENVLQFSPQSTRALARPSWWSSRPSSSQDSSEILLFAAVYPHCVLSEIRIKPLMDPFQGSTTYTWKQTIIRAYSMPIKDPNSEQPELNDTASPLSAGWRGFGSLVKIRHLESDIEDVVGQHTPVYEYTMPCPRIASILSHVLRGIVANVFTLTLEGKNFEQHEGETGFYAAVESVDCRGIPLYIDEAADLECRRASGR
jgi:hypothetical protein